MNHEPSSVRQVPRIETLTVKNYRALKDLHLKKLSPLSAFLGPNGSGKSTLFDVFAFLSECFSEGLRRAWDKRERFKQLHTRGTDGPIEFELQYREKPRGPLITYHLSIAEEKKGPVIAEEWLSWKKGARGASFRFLDFKLGSGQFISGEMPDIKDKKILESLASPEMLAVTTLGVLAKNPRVNALRRFISGWHLSSFEANHAHGARGVGPQEHLSASGDNLANVIQYLKEQHPQRLNELMSTMTHRIPRLERIDHQTLADGRFLLQIKDAPFDQPILARFASDGTLKMLAFLTLLYDPDPPQLIGIEEPDNQLHPRLLPELAEECGMACERTQLMVTTHSPYFVNGLQPHEVWVLHRDEKGFTQAKRTADMRGIAEFIEGGAQLGALWMEGHFDSGDPLTRSGAPAAPNHASKA
jgi:predicted ATPase